MRGEIWRGGGGNRARERLKPYNMGIFSGIHNQGIHMHLHIGIYIYANYNCVHPFFFPSKDCVPGG